MAASKGVGTLAAPGDPAARTAVGAAARAQIRAAVSAPSDTAPANATANANSAASADPASQAAADAAALAAATGAAVSGARFANADDPGDSSTDDLAVPATGAAAQAANQAAAGAVGGVTPTAAVSAPAIAALHATASAAALRAEAMASVQGSGFGKQEHGDDASDTSNTAADAAAGTSAAQAGLGLNATDVLATPTLRVPAAMDSLEFGQGLSDRLSYMVENNLSSAKLQVNPPQLGPIEVRIAVQGDHAQVWLTSHSAVTRDALESSSPKLREMLGAQGFGQVSVDISQRSFQDRSPQPQPYEWSPAAGHDFDTSSVSAAPAARISRGAVDAYA